MLCFNKKEVHKFNVDSEFYFLQYTKFYQQPSMHSDCQRAKIQQINNLLKMTKFRANTITPQNTLELMKENEEHCLLESNLIEKVILIIRLQENLNGKHSQYRCQRDYVSIAIKPLMVIYKMFAYRNLTLGNRITIMNQFEGFFINLYCKMNLNEVLDYKNFMKTMLKTYHKCQCVQAQSAQQIIASMKKLFHVLFEEGKERKKAEDEQQFQNRSQISESQQFSHKKEMESSSKMNQIKYESQSYNQQYSIQKLQQSFKIASSPVKIRSRFAISNAVNQKLQFLSEKSAEIKKSQPSKFLQKKESHEQVMSKNQRAYRQSQRGRRQQSEQQSSHNLIMKQLMKLTDAINNMKSKPRQKSKIVSTSQISKVKAKR